MLNYRFDTFISSAGFRSWGQGLLVVHGWRASAFSSGAYRRHMCKIGREANASCSVVAKVGSEGGDVSVLQV